MKTLSITFEGKTCFLQSVDHNGTDYFNLNDIFNASSEVKNSKRPANWRNKLSYRYQNEGKMVKLSLRKNANVIVDLDSKDGAFYGCQEVVIAYSQWLQADFAYAVNQAFSALVDGDVDKALSIAQTVASFHRERAREEYKELASCIKDSIEDKRFNFSYLGDSISYRNINNILWKFATGKPLPKPSPKNLRDELVSLGLDDQALRLDTGTTMLIGLLNAKLPYDTIKTVMGVK